MPCGCITYLDREDHTQSKQHLRDFGINHVLKHKFPYSTNRKRPRNSSIKNLHLAQHVHTNLQDFHLADQWT